MIKLLVVLISAGLNFAGGYHWLWARRYVMSTLIAGYCAWHTVWWTFPIILFPLIICLSLHDQNRGVWSALDALGASFALLLTGHLFWLWWVLYCAGNFGLGWFINNKLKSNQLVNDLVEGAGLAGIVFLI